MGVSVHANEGKDYANPEWKELGDEVTKRERRRNESWIWSA